MTPLPGARIGPYEIVASIHVNDIGRVYRAWDTTRARDVALKILPDTFTIDAERVARFQRDASTLGALNHPHIATVLGYEQVGSSRFVVMELVEGSNLAERVARGPIPVAEALPIAAQIADALAAAHEVGVIHRNLKPANITVNADGVVKVLDFGLIKMLAPSRDDAGQSGSPITTTAVSTHAGVILATVAYLSPEQAKGSPADQRSDIWAFGCVLYEMLTGMRAFGADNVTDTLALVLTREPVWTLLPPNAAVRRLLFRCLQKDCSRRLPHIAVARGELDEAQRELSGSRLAVRGWRRWVSGGG